MKHIVLFDTYQGSMNEGDGIIKEYIETEMSYLFHGANIARFSTHLPISRFYQVLHKNLIYKVCDAADYKFLCGTNLFKTSLMRLSPDWNINFTSCSYYKNSIAIGCGLDVNSRYSDVYTKKIYKKILSPNYIHSVRDERTKLYFETLGFKALNTGCPTLWGLTPEVCSKIPTKKHNSVIFTLTDYKRDYELDAKFINILRENYKKLFFWIQGYDDFNYLQELTDTSSIEIIPHSLDDYRDFLSMPDVEYVGTRLHAGIYAMRHGVRSIILSIDNRADDMKVSYNLNVVSRKEIEKKLELLINSEFRTNIEIPYHIIDEWKKQFI